MEPVVAVQGMVCSAEIDPGLAAEVFDLTLDLGRACSRITALSRGLSTRSSAHARLAVQAGLAVQALSIASTAMLAAIDQQCDLDQPPTSVDIRPRGTDKNMITRCQHDPPHCWEGTKYIDCPTP